ncbi:MAG: FoF1 ATP synthase subunit a [Acholeplasmataceae bacterium]|jgi:F-type H+-transporting ATPase subunit a|nr:FoF1 ATP synthase subunit a [Acholeplasmataceae bacterium]
MNSIIQFIFDLPVYFKTSLFLMAVLILLSYIVGSKVSKLDVRDKPSKFLTIFISFIGFFNKFVKENIGKHWRYVAPLTLSMAFYVFISNISGIWALDAPTKYTAITFSLSIIAFIIVQSTGFISKSWKHLLSIFSPLPPMAPLNIISEFTPIISMALRLFGNIATGALVLTLVYRMLGWASIIVAPGFHLLFDIGFGLIQTLVIVLLTIIFASLKVDEADLNIE